MHAHEHEHSRVRDRRLLAAALALILALMAFEIGAGIVAGSLALLADAGHLLTDAAALAAALVAARLASRPARGVWTFGLGRAEILAAQANGIALLLVGVWIVYGAIRRLVSPPDVHGGIVLVVALVGAFLHVATDLAAFAGTAVAGALVLTTGWDRFDPLAGLAVAGLCLRSSWSLLRDSGRIFMEGSPAGIDPDEIAGAIATDPDVVEVHDLHVWAVTSGFPALAAHVLVSPETDCHGARRRLQRLLDDRYHLHHVTLQVDHVAQRSQPVEIASRRADD
jgi:cobalt-zinc-cadmium efflux system protein